jgi:hypothetical protein
MLSEDQQKAFQETLDKGSAFEELIRTRGWGFIKGWYQAKIQMFATNLLLKEKNPISDFEEERRELIGLRHLMGMIENDIEVARKEYAKPKEPTQK